MLIIIFGPQTPFVGWVLKILEMIVATSVGDYDRIDVNNLELLRERWPNGQGKSRIIYSDLPQNDLADLLLKANSPTMVVSDDPIDVTAHLAAVGGHDIANSLQSVVSTLCALHKAFVSHNVWAVVRSEVKCNVRTFVVALSKFIGVQLDEQQITTICLAVLHESGLAPTADMEEAFLKSAPDARPSGQWFAEQSPRDQNFIETILSGYAGLVKRRPITQLTWPPDAFYSHDVPHGSSTMRFPLTGKARHLIFGPYLFLPVGQWRANIRFAVDEVRSGCSLVVDVVGREVLAVGEVEELPMRGVFAVSLDFSIQEATERIEVRLYMKFGSIEGLFMFGGIELARIS